MRRVHRGVGIGVGLLLLGAAATGATDTPPGEAREQSSAPTEGTSGAMRVVSLAELEWGPGPSGLPRGVEAAVVRGDPARGPFVLYAYLPQGLAIPAHHHPTHEDVTVLQGLVALGHGTAGPTRTLVPGGYFGPAAGTVHRLRCEGKGGCILLVAGSGAFEITYANPEDDPRRVPREGGPRRR